MKKSIHYFSIKMLYLLMAFLFLFNLMGLAGTHYYIAQTGNNANDGLSMATAKLTLPAAVSIAVDGDVIHMANGNYLLNATLNLNHALTIIGESEAGVIINASTTPSGAWAINPNKSNTSLSYFTLIPNSVNGGFPIHVSDNVNNPLQVLLNISLQHITINGAKKTAFDCNGVTNLSLGYLTATNTTNGNGIQTSGCWNVTADHITTNGNAWGGFAVYVSKAYPGGVGRGSNNVSIDASTSSFGEALTAVGIYNQDEAGFINAIISVAGFDFSVQNPTSSPGYTFFCPSKSSALAVAAALAPIPANSFVKQISTNQFVVGGAIKIQTAINAALAGDIINIDPGTYDEKLIVPKSVTIKGGGATQPIIHFSGTVIGKPSIFDISASNVTIENLHIKVDLTRLTSGIIVSGASVNNITISSNIIEAIGLSAAASFGPYGNRNAVSINYGGPINYRMAAGGVNNVSFVDNVIAGTINDGFGVSRFFRSGISGDEVGGTFTGNTIQSINHDILVRFGSNGNITLMNNQLNGGGIELNDMNAGAGILTVANNSFNASFANVSAPGTAVLRLKNNYNFKTTSVINNTFSNHEWAISLENYNSIILDNNQFTPLAGSLTYHHIAINTKSISTNSSTIVQKTIGAVLTNNTFNGSGIAGGAAISFYNHDNDAAGFGAFTIGTPGNENKFNTGIANVIALDNQSGSSLLASFPAYTSSLIGAGAAGITTMTPWTLPLNVENNLFDVGAGLQLPSATMISGLFKLEDRIQHKIDVSTLGLVTVAPNQVYVTINSSLTPVTSVASIQRAVDAASNGFIVNVDAGTFTDNIIVNKEIEIKGQSQSATKIIPSLSNSDCGGSGGGSLCSGASNIFLIKANNVVIDHVTIDGDNNGLVSGTVVAGADIDARNGIITDHTSGVYNNLNVHHVTVQNVFLRGIYASSGGSFIFSNNTLNNIQGNTSSIALFNYGGSGTMNNNSVSNANDAIASNWSKGTLYSNNTVTLSASGIHTDNNGGQGGIADIIESNRVTNSLLNGYGIWVFAPYESVMVRNNIVSNVDVGMASAGQQLPVTTVFSGNVIDGQHKPNSTGMYITSSLFGYGSSNSSVSFVNNIVTNNNDGFYLESELSNTLTLSAHHNSITDNSNSNLLQGVGVSGAGNFVSEMECNWWGSANDINIAAGIQGTGVDYSPWLVNGMNTIVSAPGFNPVAGTCAEAISNVMVAGTTAVQCFSTATGSASFSFDNGFGSITYSLDGGVAMNILSSPFTIHELSAGSHAMVMTDGGGNVDTINFAITEPSAISVVYSVTPILCNGGLSTESITINGGTAPYTVTNQGGGVLVSGAATGVMYHGNTFAASYTYTVTDANGCLYTFNVNIPQPSDLQISASATPIVCNGTSTVTITATGGTAPYSGTGTFLVSAGSHVFTISDANGCTATTTLIPSMAVDNTVPIITVPTHQIFCVTAGGIYTIPLLSATDNCGIASMTYIITGVTNRFGTGNNASGNFNVGQSTITWTVTDINGNSNSQSTTVKINQSPAATITVSNADQFCNKIVLTASAGTAYNWAFGSSSFAGTQQISLGQSNADGLYTVTVTVNGCTGAPVSYLYQKQKLINSYTILAFDEIVLGEKNIVAGGSIGVISAWGEVVLHKNSAVASPGSFVKARRIDKDGSNITIANPIYSAATGIVLPTMFYNTANTNRLPNMTVTQNTVSTLTGNYKNLTLKKGSITVLTGNTFGTIRVEQGAQVRFTSTTINIDNLQVTKGPRNEYSFVRFAQNTKVLVSNTVTIASQVIINPDNNKVTFYLGDRKNDQERFTIKGGDTRVTANIFIPDGKLKVTGGYRYGDYGNGYGNCDRDDDEDRYYGQGSSNVYMTGLFIGEEVEGNGKNVIWKNYDCGVPALPIITATNAELKQNATVEKSIISADEELRVTVLPNPTTTYFTLKLESKYETPVNMRVMDGSGRVVDAKSKIGANSTFQIGHNYSSGTYYAELIQGTQRKVVQLIKAKG